MHMTILTVNMKVAQIVILTFSFSFVLSRTNKRILLTDASYVQQLEQKVQTLTATTTAKIDDLTSKFTSLTNELAQEKSNNVELKAKLSNLSAMLGAGGTYVRWGRSSCPTNTSELVYSGYAGTSWYDDTGAATNQLCMTSDPEWQTNTRITPDGHGPRIFGVEYYVPGEGNVAFHDDATCAVCRSHRSSIVMVPGRKSCYNGWMEEYTGYLVAGQRNHIAGSQFVCMDDQPEAIPHGKGEQDGGFFLPVTSHCGSLTCPPYLDNKIVLCVVCSK